MASLPATQLELHFSCRHLPNKDQFSKSDPQIVVYQFVRPTGWQEVGRTEQVKDTLDPSFAKSVTVEYRFEENQQFRFHVIDVDAKNPDISKHDKLGSIEITLAQIVSSPGRILQRPLERDGKPLHKAEIKIVAEEVSNLKQIAKFRFSAKNLDKKDLFGKSDPYFQINRVLDDGSKTVVYRSKHIMKTLNPDWKEDQIKLSTLCSGHVERPLSIDVYDWDSNSDHDLIGSFFWSVQELLSGRTTFDVLNPKKKGKSSGIFVVQAFTIETIPSFVDYISSGTNLSLAVAIDFTGSNGDPNEPSSLHYRNAGRMNSYEEAIWGVGSILEGYDTDKMYPGGASLPFACASMIVHNDFPPLATGFGAKLGSTGQVSHCFSLTMDPNNKELWQPTVHGVSGILEVYQHALSQVTLWGPTNFAPTINNLASRISSDLSTTARGTSPTYHILLIITDGEITDLTETTKAIVQASSLPLSIIIVGVGNADFGAMRFLDGDETGGLRDEAGRRSERDV
ncbi:Copine-8, partial [Rhizophlyctis rosea]